MKTRSQLLADYEQAAREANAAIQRVFDSYQNGSRTQATETAHARIEARLADARLEGARAMYDTAED